MVSLDKEFEKAKQFKVRKDFDFPVYSSVGGVPDFYASESIPTTMVVSPEGNLVYWHEGMANYNTKSFRKFLAEVSGKELAVE